MKRITLLLTILTALLVCKTVFSDDSNDAPDSWTMGKTSCWGRDKDAVTLSENSSEIQNGAPVRRVDYTGVNDWAVTPMSKTIPVQPGEIWELSCDVKVKGEGKAQIGVVAYDNSEVVHWNYGEKSTDQTNGWKRLTSRFVVERNVTSIQPRLTGVGSSSVWFANYTAKRIDRLELPTEDKVLTIENAALRGEFHTLNGALDVTDKRSGRVWRQNSVNARHWIFRSRKLGQRKIAFDLFLTNVQNVVSCTFEIDEKKPEILFTLDAPDKSQPLDTRIRSNPSRATGLSSR